VFVVATIAATPEPGGTSSLAKSAIRNTETLIGILASLLEEFPGETGRHAGANNPSLVLDSQVIGMEDKASLRELTSVEVRDAIKIRVHGRD